MNEEVLYDFLNNVYTTFAENEVGLQVDMGKHIILVEYKQLNDIIDYIAAQGDRIGSWNIDKEEQMRATSRSLSEEMIYTKFLQGQFVVGIAGGVFDPIYVNRISNYAVLKYRRRFLRNKMAGTDK